METTIEETSAGPVVRCRGRFDAHEVDAFNDRSLGLVGSGRRIEVDLSAVDFIDSSGLAALIRAMKRAREHGGDVVLRSPSDAVTVILELTRLDAAFDILP